MIIGIIHYITAFPNRVKIFESHCSFKLGFISTLYSLFNMTNFLINSILWFLKLKLTILCRVGTHGKKMQYESQWTSGVIWTSNGRLYKVQTSYRRPLDVQRTSDAHQDQHLNDEHLINDKRGRGPNKIRGVLKILKINKQEGTSIWYLRVYQDYKNQSTGIYRI